MLEFDCPLPANAGIVSDALSGIGPSKFAGMIVFVGMVPFAPKAVTLSQKVFVPELFVKLNLPSSVNVNFKSLHFFDSAEQSKTASWPSADFGIRKLFCVLLEPH